MNLIRRSAPAILIAVLAALAPAGAHADSCSSAVIIYGYVADAESLYLNGIKCVVLGPDGVDARVLDPGATSVSVRYQATSDPGLATMTGRLDGLGAHADLVLTKNVVSVAGVNVYYYDSATFAIDPTAMGCITATVHVDPEDPESDDTTVFRTVDTQTC